MRSVSVIEAQAQFLIKLRRKMHFFFIGLPGTLEFISGLLREREEGKEQNRSEELTEMCGFQSERVKMGHQIFV